VLRELGECLNYNAYGESVEDLLYHPAELYRRMRPYADPLEFARQAAEFESLRRAYREDMERAHALPLQQTKDGCVAAFMPEQAWSRRVSGAYANELSQRHAGQAIALLVRSGKGYRVSLRAPRDATRGIDTVAREFESGNGRRAAAGIQFLPEQDVERLLEALERAYAA
jgi:single-stranded DNA-specific DHH superfamily exonuclease